MNKQIKQGIGLWLGLMLLSQTGIVSALSEKNFPDVSNNTDYAEAINWTVEQEITQGYPDGTWQPDNCVLRAELVKMVLEANGSMNLALPKYTALFPDIKPSEWYYDYANLAKQKGFVKGYDDGFFRGYLCVNRAEAMKIVVNAMLANPVLTPPRSALFYGDKIVIDIPYLDWYAPFADFLFKNRLIGMAHIVNYGVDKAIVPPMQRIRFFPEGNMSRKEVAELLYRLEQFESVVPQT